jgi:hypothetical protein
MNAILLITENSGIRKRNYEKDEKRWDAAASAHIDQEYRVILRIRVDSIAEGKPRKESLTAIGLREDCVHENWINIKKWGGGY